MIVLEIFLVPLPVVRLSSVKYMGVCFSKTLKRRGAKSDRRVSKELLARLAEEREDQPKLLVGRPAGPPRRDVGLVDIPGTQA